MLTKQLIRLTRKAQRNAWRLVQEHLYSRTEQYRKLQILLRVMVFLLALLRLAQRPKQSFRRPQRQQT